MKVLRLSLLLSAALITSQPAAAQNAFDGFRIDVGVAGDRFYSEGNNNNEIGVGASAGLDFALGDTVTVGPEVSFLYAPSENITRDGAGVARRKSFEEYGAGLRLGFALSPTTLFYGKAMYVVNEQRKLFTADNPLGSYRNEYRTQGYQLGAGIEQALSSNFYLKAEGRYSNYRTNSSRITGLLGVGLRFGGADEVAPPPPPPPVVVAPPPPPPPATQTCPDGSVILATDACPVPPPPPPPPPAAPERG